MNSNIRFVLYLIAFVLVGAWLFTVVKSCNNNKVQRSQTLSYQQYDDMSSDASEGMTDDEIDEELEAILTEMPETSQQEIDPDASFDYTSPPKSPPKAVEEKKEEKPVVNQRPVSASTSSAHGQYLVIAGSYGVRGNAVKQKEKLSKLGYPSAEVRQFDDSKYYTVIAGRYASKKVAQDEMSVLKQKGIDTYVKKREE